MPTVRHLNAAGNRQQRRMNSAKSNKSRKFIQTIVYEYLPTYRSDCQNAKSVFNRVNKTLLIATFEYENELIIDEQINRKTRSTTMARIITKSRLIIKNDALFAYTVNYTTSSKNLRPIFNPHVPARRAKVSKIFQFPKHRHLHVTCVNYKTKTPTNVGVFSDNLLKKKKRRNVFM